MNVARMPTRVWHRANDVTIYILWCLLSSSLSRRWLWQWLFLCILAPLLVGHIWEADPGGAGSFSDGWMPSPWVPAGWVGLHQFFCLMVFGFNGRYSLGSWSSLSIAPELKSSQSHATATDTHRSPGDTLTFPPSHHVWTFLVTTR